MKPQDVILINHQVMLDAAIKQFAFCWKCYGYERIFDELVESELEGE